MTFRTVAGLAGVLLSSHLAIANPVVIQPGAATSKDTFVYQFLPTFNFDGGPFGALLSSGTTTTGHNTRAFLEFDLTGASLGAGEYATLNLWVTDTAAAGFGVSPTPAFPVTTDVYAVTSPWAANLTTWNSQPTIDSTVAGSAVVDGIGRWMTIDVTSQVQAWLNAPSNNLGFALLQRDAVSNGGPVMAVYDSSLAANRPFLQIVPEPLTALPVAVAVLALRRRVRQ